MGGLDDPRIRNKPFLEIQMVATKRAEELLVKFSDVTIGERAAAVSVSFKLKSDDPAAHVGHVWQELYKRRLTGKIILGDDMPNQKRMDERPEIEAAFDTGKPSFGEEEATLRITFDRTGVDANLLIMFSHKTGWLLVDAIGDIPKAVSEKVQKEKREQQRSTTRITSDGVRKTAASQIGLTNTMLKKLFDADVKRVGDVIDLVTGEFEGATLESLKITKTQLTKIRQKVGLYLEDKGQEIPW